MSQENANLVTVEIPVPAPAPVSSGDRRARLADLEPLQVELRRVAGENAMLRVARGDSKRPVEQGFLQSPITPEQAREHDAEMERDPNKSFIILAKQTCPQLLFIDIDKPDKPHAKRIIELCEAAGAWQCQSKSGGVHFYLLRDAGAQDLFPGDKHRTLLMGTRSDSVVVGEALSYHIAAYRGGSGRLMRFCEVEGLFELLTGKKISPLDRLNGMKRDLVQKIKSRGDQRNNGTFEDLLGLARRIKENGLEDHREELVELVADTYAEVNPSDKQAFNKERVREHLDRVELAPMPDLSTDRTGGILGRAYYQILDAHGGKPENIVINAAEDNPEIRTWLPGARDWGWADQSTVDRGQSMMERIGEAVVSAFYDATGDAPGMAAKQNGEKVVWKELEKNCSVRLLRKQFDYPEDNDVVYLNYGEGKVARISARREDWEKGEHVQTNIDNKPEYRAAAKMTAPAETESQPFLDLCHKILDEEGVVEWHLMKFGEALCPAPIRRPDFVSWTGTGGNGKTLVASAVAHALGDHALLITDKNVLVQSRSGTVEPRQLGVRSQMVNRKLVFIDEAATLPGQILDESFIKAATSGEEVATGDMHAKNVAARVDGKLFAMSNMRFKLTSLDSATTRRMCNVRFTNIFDDGKEKHGNVALKADMRDEAPGIVRILLNYAAKYIDHFHRSGGQPVEVPAAIRAATSEWFENQNVVQSKLQAFFKVPEKGAAVPEVKKGNKRGGNFNGVAGVAALLIESEDSQRNPMREATTFLNGLGHTKCEGRPTYALELTQEGVEFIAGCGLSPTEAERVLGAVFDKSERGLKMHGAALRAAMQDSEPTAQDAQDIADLAL